MRTFTVTVTFAPSFGPGAFRETARVKAADAPKVMALLGTHGYGSEFMRETGEYVIAVAAELHADGQATDQECMGTAWISKATARRLSVLTTIL